MRRLAVVGMLACAAVLGACGSDSVTSSVPASMAGSWTLQSINGMNLPVTVTQSSGDSFALVSDVITADSAGAFTELTLIETTVSGQMAMDTVADAGTYKLSGTSVSLTFMSDSSTATGTLAGNTLSLGNGVGGSMVYARK